MAKTAFVLIYLILAAAGRQTNSALLSAQENEGSTSLVNALDEASASITQPKERDLMRRDGESGASNAGSSKMLPETQPCYRGYWREGVCTPCPAGSFSKSGVNVCVPCAPGFYNDIVGQSQCRGCPSHQVAPSSGSTSCSYCPVPMDTYDFINCIYRTEPTKPPVEPTRSPTSPPTCGFPTGPPTLPPAVVTCAPGYINIGVGCEPCRPGYYESFGMCSLCEPGFFTSSLASTICRKCLAGTVAPYYGSRYCDSCSAPSYTVDGITCISPVPTSLLSFSP